MSVPFAPDPYKLLPLLIVRQLSIGAVGDPRPPMYSYNVDRIASRYVGACHSSHR